MEQDKSFKELGLVERITHTLEGMDLIEVAQTGYVDTLEQQFCFLPDKYKDCYLVYILNEKSASSSMVFTRTCRDTRRLALMLRNLGMRAIPIYGQMVQEERLGALDMFMCGGCNILVCTDVASRGLDIPSVDMVVNYNIPPNTKDYIHRLRGTEFSILLVNQYELVWYVDIERHIGKKLPAFHAQDEDVLSLNEHVKEANRLALKEMEDND